MLLKGLDDESGLMVARFPNRVVPGDGLATGTERDRRRWLEEGLTARAERGGFFG
jgi:hypothetical protein